MKTSHPTNSGLNEASGLGDVSRAGHYDRPAREGRGRALLGDPEASPDNEDAASGRAKPNSTRAGRSIEYLDDRKGSGTDPGVSGVAGPGTPGHGRRMPQYKDDEKMATATDDVSKLDEPI